MAGWRAAGASFCGGIERRPAAEKEKERVEKLTLSGPGEADVSLKTVVLAEKAAQAVHRALRPQRGILFYGQKIDPDYPKAICAYDLINVLLVQHSSIGPLHRSKIL